MLLRELSCLISNTTFLDINFSVARGFVGLPGQDLVLGFRAVSSQSPKLQPGWITFFATMPSLDEALVMLQSVHGVIHLSRSRWLHELSPLVSDPVPIGSRLEASRFPLAR